MWPIGSGRPHQNSAATTRAHDNRNKPTPSRRKAGSMSNDSLRTRRVAPPSPPAKAIQIRATPRPNATKTEDRLAAPYFLVGRDVDADGPLRAGKARRRE